LAVVGALVLALSVTAGVLAVRATAASQREAARSAATEAARTAVPQVLSYNYATINADIARATERLTGDFAQDYARVAADVVLPTAAKDQVVTSASLTGVSVMTASSSTVRLLLFVNQSTTSSEKPTAISASRVVATMSKVGGSWLISDLRAV
jgi:Mce-associated membrane protein